MRKLRKMYCITLVIAIIVVLIDQISKGVINNTISLNEHIGVLGNFFYLTNIENYGAAWGIMANETNFLIIFTVVALVILWQYEKLFKRKNSNAIIFGFLVGGVIGNLIDRLALGFVRDFIGFKIFNYNFPIFNLSDTFIVIGAFLLIIAIIKKEDKYEVRSKKSTGTKTKAW